MFICFLFSTIFDFKSAIIFSSLMRHSFYSLSWDWRSLHFSEMIAVVGAISVVFVVTENIVAWSSSKPVSFFIKLKKPDSSSGLNVNSSVTLSCSWTSPSPASTASVAFVSLYTITETTSLSWTLLSKPPIMLEALEAAYLGLPQSI